MFKMPIYAMSCFRLPKLVCKKLTSAISNFLWNAQEDNKKMHWVAWEKLCMAKRHESLGFRIWNALIKLYWLEITSVSKQFMCKSFEDLIIC